MYLFQKLSFLNRKFQIFLKYLNRVNKCVKHRYWIEMINLNLKHFKLIFYHEWFSILNTPFQIRIEF